MSLRQRLRRLRRKAEEGGVLIRQRDGSVRVFEVMDVLKEMYRARTDLFRDTAVYSAVLDAVRNATSESRASFEERFGPIAFSDYVIGSSLDGGWVERYSLTEGGRVERVRYEGGSEKAILVREGLKGGRFSEHDVPPAGRSQLATSSVPLDSDEDLSE